MFPLRYIEVRKVHVFTFSFMANGAANIVSSGCTCSFELSLVSLWLELLKLEGVPSNLLTGLLIVALVS